MTISKDALPKVVLSPHFRRVDEIFAEGDLRRLRSFSNVVWAKDEPIPADELARHAGDMWALVTARPSVDAALLEAAPNLRAIVEVAGRFPNDVDYDACFARQVRVLSCAPAFGSQVAEMTLAMMLAAGRGLVAEHETFRLAEEHWQRDREGWDFTLFGQSVGLIGAGSIAKSLLQLIEPFGCRIRAYDPWLPKSVIEQMGCEPASLEETLRESRIVILLAVPTTENEGLIGSRELELMQPGSLLLLVSRSHLVDFDALTDALYAHHLQAAVDVFPEEPLPADHPIRQSPNVILSAHRAASIRKERQAIGRLVVDDLELMANGLPPVRLQIAQPELVPLYTGRST
ncbi:MAG: hydroxyacid dehydrogenase [Pseudomonadota bacterium]